MYHRNLPSILLNQVPRKDFNIIQSSIAYTDTVWGSVKSNKKDMIQKSQIMLVVTGWLMVVTDNYDITFRDIDIVK